MAKNELRMSLMKGDVETKTVEIDPPDEVVERARKRAGANESLDEYLLDQYLFEYEWIGVDADADA